MRALKTALILIALGTSTAAQDLMRGIEMPGHQALMTQSAGAEVTPFESDGCSGGLSASWRLVADIIPSFAARYENNPPWEYCCVTHDSAYHNAGGATRAEDSYDARLSADDALHACVEQHGDAHAEEYADRYGVTPEQVRTAHSVTADAMYMAVRFGGGPCSGLPWRWGFGFPGCSVFGSQSPARE